LSCVHQFGSIGWATGRLGAGLASSLGPVNQESGEAHFGASKSGPTVQPASRDVSKRDRASGAVETHRRVLVRIGGVMCSS
jgi:hypothetical protein